MTKILFDSIQPQLKLIVKAIQKAAGEDSREFRQANNLVTLNSARTIISDFINTNLNDSVVSESLELRKFTRFGWEGCILIDRINKLTFSICSKNTLDRIRKDLDRKHPHYLQTLLNVLNSCVKPRTVQLMLFDIEPVQLFSEEEYILDYRKIMGDDVFPEDGYTHWIIVYRVCKYCVESISMVKLDRYFQLSEEIRLEDMLLPDFGDLTIEDTSSKRMKDVHSLVKLKDKGLTSQNGSNGSVVKVSLKTNEEENEA